MKFLLFTLFFVFSTTSALAQSCQQTLKGSWTHQVGGTWEFDGGNKAKIVLNSTNFGPRALQITELQLSGCTDTSLSYKIVRAALINTVDADMAYDKTPQNSEGPWDKSFNQPYSLSGNSLKLGNYSYERK